MDRIKEKHLEYLVEQINKLTNSPATSYTKNGDGKFHANIGNYNLSFQYGGIALERIVNEGGGVQLIINRGTKREVYNQMKSFIMGLTTTKEAT